MTKKIAVKKAAPQAKGLGSAKTGPIRRQLLEMRDDLMRTVRKQELEENASQEVGDAADQASQSIEKELLFELSDNERMTIDQIEAALRKIDKGTYGVCESCRKPIAKPRLQALPFARYCIGCQSNAERAPDLAEQAPDFRGIGEETSRDA
ncbi:MAG: TraR/DksA family transcriptional regulator [Elusimicrobiota bacterium]